MNKRGVLIIISCILTLILILSSPLGLGRFFGDWFDREDPVISKHPPGRNVVRIPSAYRSFRMDMLDPFRDKLEEFEDIVDGKVAGSDVESRLNILQREVSDLPIVPTSTNPKLESLYALFEVMKESLLECIMVIADSKGNQLTADDEAALKFLYAEITNVLVNIETMTFDIFNDNGIQYFIGDDGTISIYE
ncbi:hypothetical protein [Youngiibacter multivorans]|uniref:Uncharacterized protein n=1 Tax=Youngiibacter multivorans TaxID=937251 RepID=A0ABS4G625_9CLOT|nr:hypothetical protein [Youngiibacter multivorans]MBP1920023.1 hypothetical protein [Youngiibacter multivorans]